MGKGGLGLGKAGGSLRGRQIRKSVHEDGLGPPTLKAARSGNQLSHPGACYLLGSQRV